MVLTKKEELLLADMKMQEELCIKKYNSYAADAKSEILTKLFSDIAKTESSHLDTVNRILSGECVREGGSLSANNQYCCEFAYKNESDRADDAFFINDMLAMEKHVSSLYDTSIFEFSSPEIRRTLNHIQAEEQQHGEQLYAYMKANNMIKG